MSINILHVLPDNSTDISGVKTLVIQLANNYKKSTREYGTYVTTSIGTKSQNAESKYVYINPEMFSGFKIRFPEITKQIIKVIKERNISLIHIHGIWRPINLAGVKAGRQCKIPIVMTTHGMLNPWLWNKQGIIKYIKKKIYFHVMVKRIIKSDVNMHVITEREKIVVGRLFPKLKIVTIPNAVDTSDYSFKNEYKEKGRINETILFLGRLHPIKGIEILLEAFWRASLPKKWKLSIAGPVYKPKYSEKLKKIIKKYELEDRVCILGPVVGTEKRKLLSKSWILVLPSYSEVIGMVNLEAAMHKTPSITTYETGLSNWESGGGILIQPDVIELEEALKKVAGWTIEERLRIGKEAQKYIENSYSWNTVIPKWKNYYDSILKK